MDGALILVIEDETLLRENIAEIIGHFGFRVISVPTGEEAIKVMKECTPDIIICDIKLPEIDGYEVFARVKQMPKLVPV